MTTPSSWPLIAICGLVSVTSLLHGEEVILHTGPPVSTPAATPVTPVQEQGSLKLINFQREFFIDRDRLASLPQPSSEFGTVPISAVEAIKLATKHTDPQGGLRTLIVTEVRLLRGPVNVVRPIEYYLVSMLANGSEEHRIVLMNGEVISSKLRKIEDK
jgi:hypothetical protein